MTGDAEVRQFQLADEPPLLSFLRLAYPDDPRKSDPVFWRWHYLQNPHADLHDIPLWIAASGDQIVGQLATIPVQLKAGDDSIRAIWVLDFIVREDQRGKGLGKRLVQAASEYGAVMLTLGINEQSKAVFCGLGWKEMGRIHRYQKPLFAGNASDAIAQFAPLRGLANAASAPLRRAVRRSAQREKYAARKVARFDSSFDDLWGRARSQWPCTVERSAGYLEWQFARQPGKEFDAIGLYERDQLAGFVVMFFRKPLHGTGPPKASISDLCFAPDGSDEIIDCLLEAALDRTIERRAGTLVTDVLNPRVEARLRRFGFWRVKKSPEFMAWTQASNAGLIYDPEVWFLTRADADVSIFERPNI